MKVLVIEDAQSKQEKLSDIISLWGFQSVSVDNELAVRKLISKSESPQLLLLDNDAPNVDCFALCESIRLLDKPDPPYIILLDSSNNSSNIVKAFNKGVNDYITKPFDNAELKVRLQAGQSRLELQDALHKANDQLSIEKSIIEDIILTMRSTLHFDDSRLRYIQSSVEKTSGDVLFSAFRPDNAQHIMLGDFTGHGLTAAIGGPLASDTFYSMTAKGLPMSIIVEEINHHMCEKMPVGLFLGAILIEVNPERTKVKVWNCGMEDVLVFRDESLITSITSDNLSLGIVDEPIENMLCLDVQPGDLIYAYSDGLTETKDKNGTLFGQQCLVKMIEETLASKSDIEHILDTVIAFRNDIEQKDDMTLLELKC